jgi:hypothetical protein
MAREKGLPTRKLVFLDDLQDIREKYDRITDDSPISRILHHRRVQDTSFLSHPSPPLPPPLTREIAEKFQGLNQVSINKEQAMHLQIGISTGDLVPFSTEYYGLSDVQGHRGHTC